MGAMSNDKSPFPPIEDLFEMYVGMKFMKEINDGLKENPNLRTAMALMIEAHKPKNVEELYKCFLDAKEVGSE